MNHTRYNMTINLPQPLVDRIHTWNEERGLLKSFNVDTEVRLLKEEMQEFLDAVDKYEGVDALCDMLVVFTGTLLKAEIHNIDLLEVYPDFVYVSEYIDTNFDTIKHLGFEPKCAMNETLLEIESRTGHINELGKFEKDKDTKTYEANYDLCQLKS